MVEAGIDKRTVEENLDYLNNVALYGDHLPGGPPELSPPFPAWCAEYTTGPGSYVSLVEAAEKFNQVMHEMCDALAMANITLAFIEAQLACDPCSAPRRLKKSIRKLETEDSTWLRKLETGYSRTTWRERYRVKRWIDHGNRAWDRYRQARADQDKREGREAFVPPPAEKSTANLTVETTVFHCYGKNPW
jgi:hypothetical protein